LDKFAPARALSFCGAVCRVALTSFGHLTSAHTVTLFSSVAILLPWEQFLSSSGALPWVQKLRGLRRERSSVGRDPGVAQGYIFYAGGSIAGVSCRHGPRSIYRSMAVADVGHAYYSCPDNASSPM